MASTTFSGPVTSSTGFVATTGGITATAGGFLAGTIPVPLQLGAPTTVVNATGATLTVTAATHSGKLVTLNRAAGIAVTLPAAAGTGNVYRFLIGTAVTSNATTIAVANASDTMIGFVLTTLAAGGTTFGETAQGTDDTISMNGTTTGGLVGSYVECTDYATNVWYVRGYLAGSGTLASMLSATV